MKQHSKKLSAAKVLWGVLLLIIGLISLPLLLRAAAPGWWETKKVYAYDDGQIAAPSDYSAANQGQLKNMAVGAYEHLLSTTDPVTGIGGLGAVIPPNPAVSTDKGSVGWRLKQLVSQWVVLNTDLSVQRDGNGHRVLQTTAAKDFTAINQGQLKAVAKPFYERLNEIYAPFGYPKPWTDDDNPATTEDTEDDESFAAVNLGQLKNVFSFDLNGDSDGDGMSDLAELRANLNIPTNGVALNPFDPDSDKDDIVDGAETATNPHLFDTDGDGEDDYFSYQLTRPTGLRIRFPDALANPKDPDLSMIRVEWDAPNLPEVHQVTVEHTYIGNPNDWALKATLATNQTSQEFTGLLSKRTYVYKVVFHSTDGRTSAAFITYELPTIRALMTRKISLSTKFQGGLLYADSAHTGIPKKFRKFSRSFNNVEDFWEDDMNSWWRLERHHERQLSLIVEHDLAAAKRKLTNFEYDFEDQDFPNQAVYHYDSYQHSKTSSIDEPLPQSPSGTANTVIDDWTDGDGTSTTDFDSEIQIQFTLRPRDIAALSPPNTPFISLTGFSTSSDQSYTATSNHSNEFLNDVDATLGLGADGGNQIAVWTGNLTHTHIEDDVVVDQYLNEYGGGEPDYLTNGFKYSLPEFEAFAGGTATLNTTINGTSWTFLQEDAEEGGLPGYAENLAAIASWENEVTTSGFLQLAMSANMSFSNIPWYYPRTSITQQLSSNELGGLVNHWFTDSLDWEYGATYDPSVSAEALESVPVGNLHFEPSFHPLVGTFSLDHEETWMETTATEYKYRLYPSAEAYEFVWTERFVPAHTDDCPSNWVPKEQWRLRRCMVQPNDTETPVQSVENTKGFSVVQAGNAPSHLHDTFGQSQNAVNGPVGAISIGENYAPRFYRLVAEAPTGNPDFEPKVEIRCPKVANWDNAFNNNLMPLRADFVSRDPDQFFIQIAKRPEEEVPPKVKLEVVSSDPSHIVGERIIDDATEIEMISDPSDGSNWRSKVSHILVSDKYDDETRSQSNDIEVGDILAGAGVDDLVGDRSHLVEYGADICIHVGEGADLMVFKTKMLPRAWINLNPIALRNSIGGQPARTHADISVDIQRNVVPKFMQVEVWVGEWRPLENPYQNPPDDEKFDLSNGFQAGEENNKGPRLRSPTNAPPDLLMPPSVEANILFDKFPSNERKDVINAFYIKEVNYIDIQKRFVKIDGMAYVNEKDKGANSVVMRTPIGLDKDEFTTAHEVGHILTKSGGHYINFDEEHRYLMYERPEGGMASGGIFTCKRIPRKDIKEVKRYCKKRQIFYSEL